MVGILEGWLKNIYLIYSLGNHKKTRLQKVVFFSRLFCGLQLGSEPVFRRLTEKKTPIHMFTFFGCFRISDSGGGGEMLDSHAFKGKPQLMIQQLQPRFSGRQLLRETEVKNNCWNCNQKSVEFWPITPHFQQYVYQLKTPPTMGS